MPFKEFCNPLSLGEYWYWPSTHKSGVMSVSSILSCGAGWWGNEPTMKGSSGLLGSSENARRRFLRPYMTTANTAAMAITARMEATITSVVGVDPVPTTPSLSPELLPPLELVGRLSTGLTVPLPDVESLPDEPVEDKSVDPDVVSFTGKMRISLLDPEPS